MFLECCICQNRVEITRENKKYIIQEEEFCCSGTCVHGWIKRNSDGVTMHREYPIVSRVLRSHMDDPDSVLYKSDYEKAFAFFLSKIVNMKFIYEGFGFKLSTGTYTPDFWLWDNMFVEVKGQIALGFRQKLKRFRQGNPRIRLLLVPWVIKDDFYKYLK